MKIWHFVSKNCDKKKSYNDGGKTFEIRQILKGGLNRIYFFVLGQISTKLTNHSRKYASKPLTLEAISLKVAFFRKCDCLFRSPHLKKKIQKTILNLKFKFPANNTLLLLMGNINFKFRTVFWNISFLRFGDLNKQSYFLKKAPFNIFY